MHRSLFTLEFFPFSNRKGSSCKHIDQQGMLQLAKGSKKITEGQLQIIIDQHEVFLENGGAGGNWTSIVINGLVMGIYEYSEVEKGEQAHLEHCHLEEKTNLEERVLSFANCCGLYAPQLLAIKTDLSYSLLTDTYMEEANFFGANLKKTDFSRANLRHVNFCEADLRYADFENCNLAGADFRGAKLQGARFPGAVLKDVIM